MARQASTPGARDRWPRLTAAILLGFEAAMWVVGNLFAFGPGIASVIALIVVATLVGLTLLTIYLLEKSPRGALWLGLVMQALLALHGLVLGVLMSSGLVLAEVPVAMVTAICLAGAMPRGARD
jgi:hypothetical protein